MIQKKKEIRNVLQKLNFIFVGPIVLMYLLNHNMIYFLLHYKEITKRK